MKMNCLHNDKIIGHTKSGKFMYAKKHSSHDKFSKQEHFQAKDAHLGLLDRFENIAQRTPTKEQHDKANKLAKHHRMMARHHSSMAKRAKSNPEHSGLYMENDDYTGKGL